MEACNLEKSGVTTPSAVTAAAVRSSPPLELSSREVLMFRRIVAFMLAALGALPSSALSTTSIIISTTPDLTGGCVSPPTSFPAIYDLYVSTYSFGPGGITGAEFGVTGFEGLTGFPPSGSYLVTSTPNPSSGISLGDPITGGTNIAFSTCQTSSAVLLYTLHVVNFSDSQLRPLRIVARQPPSNPSFNCPLITLCDAPVYTAQCAGGGTAYLNILRVPPAPTDPVPSDHATGVPLQLTLRWYVPPIQAEACEAGTISQDIFFGTNANPPYVNSSFGDRSYVIPNPLLPLTQYYWRVTAGPNSSPVWTFTTGDLPVAAEPRTWTQMRSLYR